VGYSAGQILKPATKSTYKGKNKNNTYRGINMSSQKDLEGNTQEVKKETVKKLTTKYSAEIFTVTVSEAGQNQLDKLHEEADVMGLRRWVAKNMKLRHPTLLRAGSEGTAFQNDLEKLCKAL